MKIGKILGNISYIIWIKFIDESNQSFGNNIYFAKFILYFLKLITEKALLEESDEESDVPIIEKPAVVEEEAHKKDEKKEKFNKNLEDLKQKISSLENKIEILKSYTKSLFDKLKDDQSEQETRKRLNSSSSRFTMEYDKKANPQADESTFEDNQSQKL